MSEPTTSWPSAGNSSSRPAEKSVSVMRKFLESGVEFQWPPEVGECVGNHCTLHPSSPIPLQWKSRISDKTASIDIYVAGTQYNYKFQEAFAVKTIREKNYLKSRTKASKEVENMRDLRYPHVAALLGTFMYLDRLSILIFPAAPCDLHVFLKSISREMLDLHRGRSHLQGLLNRTRRTDSPESRSSTSSFRERPGSPTALAQAITKAQTHDHEFWPQKLSLPAKIDSLRAYFVCLSQALSYIHTSDVRHKGNAPSSPVG